MADNNMEEAMNNTNLTFEDHKIIHTESRSWYVGKPGTTDHSYAVTWSPGALLLYGEKGNITLIFADFNSYEKTKQWLSDCTLDQFKGTVAHTLPENLDYFYKALKFWGNEPHYK